jgi:2'-5' RNA ligase
MTRTFIALELEAPQQQFLEHIMRQGQHALPDVRWVDPGGIHLTLAFLGELDGPQLQKALLAARSAATQVTPFAYRFSGLGMFGSARQPRVLWMGVSEPSGVLHAAQQALSVALERQGFPTEKRPFTPHLTLARMKEPLAPAQLQALQQLVEHYQFASPTYHVSALVVMKSELLRSGARYTCLERCMFARKRA